MKVKKIILGDMWADSEDGLKRLEDEPFYDKLVGRHKKEHWRRTLHYIKLGLHKLGFTGNGINRSFKYNDMKLKITPDMVRYYQTVLPDMPWIRATRYKLMFKDS